MARPSQSPRGHRNPGSQPALRRQNTLRVIEVLAQGGPTTQAKLARATGLSTGTISNIVKDLHSEQRISTRAVVDSGRRAIEISLNDDRISIGLDIDATRMRIVATNIDHDLVGEVVSPLPYGHDPTSTLRTARREVDALLSAHGLAFPDVVAAGVSLPIILDQDRRPLIDDPRFPSWHDQDLAGIAEAVFPFPIIFENDANVQALAHVTWGPYSLNSVLAAVKVDSGIGAGLIVNGKILRGAFGGSGELGHLNISPLGERCHCGNRGCLQTVASVDKVLSDVRRARHLHQVPTVADIVDLTRRRDPATIRVLDEAGQAIGLALASLVTLVNPHAVVISGPLAPVGAPLLDPISRAVSRHAHPAIGPRTVISMSQLGERAEALGASALAAHGATVPI
ncbi:ROK family transcriptional regulator [Aestuariimicrobium sp. Y1814]|uniref:ROK family transcriptional regulator n=1 Tax=Aestuariimicrobium sp. Y1814 TaxID=3418742 RepID=UPI003DA75E78